MRRRLALPFVLVACSSYAGSDSPKPPPTDPPLDAGTMTDAGDAGAGDGGGGDGGLVPGGPGCPEKIVYVSPGGNDGNDGCSRDKPKATIGSAIGFLQVSGLTGHEIHVCRGTYQEAVTLAYPASIRGGYECATWQRPADLHDRTNASIIQPKSEAQALTLTGAAVDASVLIEALTIQAPRLATGKSRAIMVDDHAAPRISYVDATAGQTDDGTTIGLLADNGASPAIDHSVLTGGSAECPSCAGSAASSGVWFAAGAGDPSVVDSTIRAGATTSTTGNLAAESMVTYRPLVGPRAFARNKVVWGGGGSVVSGTTTFAIVAAAEVEIVDTVIAAEAPVTCTSATDPCVGVGVYVGNAGKVTMRRLRIGTPSLSAATVVQYGVEVANGIATMDASAILLSTGATATPSILSRAFFIPSATSQLTVVGSTVVASAFLFSEGGTAELRDDVFVQLKNAAGAISLYDCRQPTTLTLENNAFVATDTVAQPLLDVHGNAGCGPQTQLTDTLAATEAALKARQPTGPVGDNVIVRPDCTGEAAGTCVPCASPSARCVIDGYTARPAEAAALLAAGMPLRTDVSCLVAQGSETTLATASPADITTKPRTAPFAIGAFELDRTCP